MLKTIRLKNFKLHEDTRIEAAPITVFIGPNNSGKSSIFQALLALRQAAARGSQQMFESAQDQPNANGQAHVNPPSQIINIGGFKDVVRRGTDVIGLELEGKVEGGDPFHPEVPADVGFLTGVRNNSLTLHKGQIKLQPVGIEWLWPNAAAEKSPSIAVEGSSLHFSATPSFRLITYSGFRRIGDEPAGAKLTQIGESLAAIPTRLLNSLHPVYPLRGFEQWGYPLPERKPDGLDLPALNERATALSGLLAYDRDLEERISQRLSELVNIRIKVRLIEGKRVTMWAEPSAISQDGTLFVNEGTGANQLPFILIPVALTPRNETILLSEPEAHLHPKGQCELMRMLLSVAKKENIQLLFETHSEHVLHTILNSVAKGEWSPADVALYYFQNKNGVAEVGKREINQFGQVDGGLPDFFEQSLTELTDYLKALSKT